MNETTLEYFETIQFGNVSLDEYLQVSPASTTVILYSNVLQSHETEILQQKQILEVRAHIFMLRGIHQLHLQHAKALYQWSQGWYHRCRITKASNVDL